MQQSVKMDPRCNIHSIGSCWPTMLRPFANSLAAEFQERKRQWRDETFWCLAIASLNPDPISENNM